MEEGHEGEAAEDAALVREKLDDARAPGFEADFDPHEAELAGACVEDALSVEDARDSRTDLGEEG